MPTEQTLVLIKPDGVMKGVTEQIKERYEAAGLRILKARAVRFREAQVKQFYKEHEGRPFFEGLVLSMIVGPSMALVLEGENAIEAVRKLNGATDPRKAEPGTIRHDFMSAGGPFNTVHASDSKEAVARELEIVLGRG